MGRQSPLTVVAFGGNALLAPDDLGTIGEQVVRAREAADWLAGIAARGERLVVVHGNGPQVGQVLIQMEEGATKVPPGTLDLAVAETQGGMGYLLELALRNRLRHEPRAPEVSTLLSLVVVDGGDPGFAHPTKPVGPFFPRFRAEALARELGWKIVEDAGRGWRKVVPSPRPLEVVGLAAARELLDAGHLVIVAGGGGIPVIRQPDGELVGVEAVIDKDYTAALVARELGADLLVVLTGVPQVMRDFGTPRAQALSVLPAAEARGLLAEGQFPPGSMGPKLEAALDFVTATGRRVLITDLAHLSRAMAGEAGTTIIP